MEIILNLITLFIATAIVLFIGTQILGNDSIGDCTDLTGYDATTPASSTQWAKQCTDLIDATVDAYGLLGVILIVIAAVAILALVRML